MDTHSIQTACPEVVECIEEFTSRRRKEDRLRLLGDDEVLEEELRKSSDILQSVLRADRCTCEWVTRIQRMAEQYTTSRQPPEPPRAFPDNVFPSLGLSRRILLRLALTTPVPVKASVKLRKETITVRATGMVDGEGVVRFTPNTGNEAGVALRVWALAHYVVTPVAELQWLMPPSLDPRKPYAPASMLAEELGLQPGDAFPDKHALKELIAGPDDAQLAIDLGVLARRPPLAPHLVYPAMCALCEAFLKARKSPPSTTVCASWYTDHVTVEDAKPVEVHMRNVRGPEWHILGENMRLDQIECLPRPPRRKPPTFAVAHPAWTHLVLPVLDASKAGNGADQLAAGFPDLDGKAVLSKTMHRNITRLWALFAESYPRTTLRGIAAAKRALRQRHGAKVRPVSHTGVASLFLWTVCAHGTSLRPRRVGCDLEPWATFAELRHAERMLTDLQAELFPRLAPYGRGASVDKVDSEMRQRGERALMQHQADGAAWLIQRNFSGMVGDTLGSGKTTLLLALLRAMPRATTALVLAPPAAFETWKREARATYWTPSGESPFRIVEADEARASLASWEVATGEEEIPRWGRERATLILVSYSIVAKIAREVPITTTFVFADEGDALRNRGTQRRKAAECVDARHCILSTGTAYNNKPSDICEALRLCRVRAFLDRRFENLASRQRLVAEFVSGVTRSVPRLIGAPDELEPLYVGAPRQGDVEERIEREGVRATARWLVGKVPLEARLRGVALLREHAALARDPRFLERCGARDPLWAAAAADGLDAMEGRVEMVREGRLVVPWTQIAVTHAGSDMPTALHHNPSLRVALSAEEEARAVSALRAEFPILSRVPRLPRASECILVYAASRDAARRAARAMAAPAVFTSEDVLGAEREHPLVFTCLSALSRAVSLKRVSTICMLSPEWNPTSEIQARARAHRLGQARVTRVVQVLARGTADTFVYKCSRKKIQEGRRLLQVVSKPIDNEVLERELLASLSEPKRSRN